MFTQVEQDKILEVLDQPLLNPRGEVYPHKFRHTFATNLVKKGVEISTVARLLGHSDIQTTISFYVNTSKDDKLKAIEKL